MPEWTLTDRLRKSREHAGLTQAALAADIEVSRRSVINYESGAHAPKKPELIAWALRCGVSYTWLSTGEAPSGTGPDLPGVSTIWYAASHRQATPARAVDFRQAG